MSLLRRFYPARAYVSYWLEAVDEHSLHSPFLFKFYNEVIKHKAAPPQLVAIEKRRKELLENRSLITLNDPGEGSLISPSDQRSIASIARHSLSPPGFCDLLYRLVQFTKPSTLLETGTSFGISTAYLAAAAPHASLSTIEGSPAIAHLARETFQQLNLPGVKLLEGKVLEVLPNVLAATPSLDVVFLDAHHNETATADYFELLLPRLHAKSIVVLGDIHWSAGMQRAWKKLAGHSLATLSVDIYDAGILFFNPNLRKETEILSW